MDSVLLIIVLILTIVFPPRATAQANKITAIKSSKVIGSSLPPSSHSSANADLVRSLKKNGWRFDDGQYSKIDPHLFQGAEFLDFSRPNALCCVDGKGGTRNMSWRVEQTRSGGGWLYLSDGSALGISLVKPNLLVIAGRHFVPGVPPPRIEAPASAPTFVKLWERLTLPASSSNESAPADKVEGNAVLPDWAQRKVFPSKLFAQLRGTSWERCTERQIGPSCAAELVIFEADGRLVRKIGDKIISSTLWSVDGAGNIIECKEDTTLYPDLIWIDGQPASRPRYRCSAKYLVSENPSGVSNNDQLLELSETFFRPLTDACKTEALNAWPQGADSNFQAQIRYARPLRAGEKIRLHIRTTSSDNHRFAPRSLPEEIFVEITSDPKILKDVSSWQYEQFGTYKATVQTVSLKPSMFGSGSLPGVHEVRTGECDVTFPPGKTSLLTLYFRDNSPVSNPQHKYVSDIWSVLFRP
jgi:hypothetical protein